MVLIVFIAYGSISGKFLIKLMSVIISVGIHAPELTQKFVEARSTVV